MNMPLWNWEYTFQSEHHFYSWFDAVDSRLWFRILYPTQKQVTLLTKKQKGLASHISIDCAEEQKLQFFQLEYTYQIVED